ncbi:MAG: dockerin type I domain-containing protein [Saccharofermentanales bacterium]
MKKQCKPESPDTGFGILSCYPDNHNNRIGIISEVLNQRKQSGKRKLMVLAAVFTAVLTLCSAFDIRMATVGAADAIVPSMNVNINDYAKLSDSSIYYAWRGKVDLIGNIPESQLKAEFISCYIDEYLLPAFTIEKADIPLAGGVYTFTALVDTTAYTKGYHDITIYDGTPAAGDDSNILWSVESYFTQDGYETIANVSTNCNMRDMPTTASPSAVLIKINLNEPVDVIGKVTGQYVADYKTDIWYHLRYTAADGTVYDGYIISALVSVNSIAMMKFGSEGAAIEDFSPAKKIYAFSLPYASSIFRIDNLVRYNPDDSIAVRMNGNAVSAPYTHLPLVAGENKVEVIVSRGSGTAAVTTVYTFDISRIPEATEAEFQAQLALFPESYRQALMVLHSKYPDWLFTAFDTGLEWGSVISNEDYNNRSLIYRNLPIEYYKHVKAGLPAGTAFSDFIDEGPQDGSAFFTASKSAVEYYIDPRNFLNERNIFMFEQLTYNPALHTLKGITDIISGTGLAGREQLFLDAAAETGVSPYHLAARSRQEVTAWNPIGLSPIANGTYVNKVPSLTPERILTDAEKNLYFGLYNFYNIGTGSSTNFDVLYMRGLNYAKGNKVGNDASKFYAGEPQSDAYKAKYKMPWDTEAKAITGGAIFIGQSYINKGQDNLYLQKFDVDAIDGIYSHQYMQNIQAPFSESSASYNAYADMSSLDNSFIFRIPVYKNMPQRSKPRPENANRLYSLGIAGYTVSPAFNPSYVGEYNIAVPDTAAEVFIDAAGFDSDAAVTGAGSVPLEFGANPFTVTCTPSSGFPKAYLLIITRSLPPKSADNYLSQLSIEGLAFDRAFKYSDFGPYTATVPYEQDKIVLSATPRSELSAITGAGSIDLEPGINAIAVTITAENGKSRVYNLKVTRTIPQLSSKVYKLAGGSMSGIATSTTVTSLKASIKATVGDLKVFGRDGAEITGAVTVGTGSIVKLFYKGVVFEEYMVVVYGDLNGEGKVNSTDLTILRSHILKSKSIASAYLAAADVNQDGKVNSTDLTIMKRHILRIKTISQTF